MAICWPLKVAVRGYSEAEAAKLSVSERRKRTTKRVGVIARALYIGVQLVCLVILLQSDSELGQSWRTSHATYTWSFLALLLTNFLLYIALCASSPGYLPVPDTDEEPAALNSPANSEQADIVQDPPHFDAPNKVRPLPYPTNHANYINLAALGRDPASEAAGAVPWWDLPVPGIAQAMEGIPASLLGTSYSSCIIDSMSCSMSPTCISITCMIICHRFVTRF